MVELTVPELPRSWFEVPGVEDIAVIIPILRVTGSTGLVLWALLTGNVGPIVTGAQFAGFYLGQHKQSDYLGEEREEGGHLAISQPSQDRETEKRGEK